MFKTDFPTDDGGVKIARQSIYYGRQVGEFTCATSAAFQAVSTLENWFTVQHYTLFKF